MEHLADHATVARSIFNLDHLRNLMEAKSDERTLLIDRSTNTTLNLLDFDCCHSFITLLTVKHFVHCNATLTSDLISITHLRESCKSSLHQVVGIGRTLRLCDDVCDTCTLQYSTHSTTGLQTGTGCSRLQENDSTTELHLNLVRNRTLEYRNLHQVLFGSLSAFGDSSGNFTGLTQTVANHALTITNNDDGSECKRTTTLCNLRHTVDSNQAVFQFCVTIYFYFIHCHNRLKFKTTLTCSISQSLYTTMIEVTIAVEDHCLNASRLSFLSDQCANFLSLLDLRHLFHTQ